MVEFTTIGKSKQFYKFLMNEILSGGYEPGSKFPSIRELSDRYNVSKTTVNLVVSNLVNEGFLRVEQGRGTFVTERKKERAGQKRKIGLIFFDFKYETNVEAPIFHAIQKSLKEDYYVIPYNSYDDMDMFYKGLKGLTELDVDGMILIPPTSEKYDLDIIRSILKKDIPLVLINRRIPGLNHDFLSMDFGNGIYKAARHILGKGRRSISLLKFRSPSITAEMLKGFQRAHDEAGAVVNPELLLDWTSDMERLRSTIAERVPVMDGFIASDFIVFKMRDILLDSSEKVSRQPSIVGINNTIYSTVTEPQLTAIPYPSEEVGSEAARIMMSRLEGAASSANIEKIFVPELVIRSK